MHFREQECMSCVMESTTTTTASKDLVNSEPLTTHHRRSLSGGLLSKLSFLRASADDDQKPDDHDDMPVSPKKQGRAMAVVVQQKTRKRRGSLRKAALLGRGAQRERREMEASPLNASTSNSHFTCGPTSTEESTTTTTSPSPPPTIYTSTTDEDDGLSISSKSAMQVHTPTRATDGYFSPFSSPTLVRRRSQNGNNGLSPRKRSPLALSPSLSTLSNPDTDWDYSETEWWGWIILIITWLVFVTGMGSCLGVWSWAWDVGETPYAPPELEDDPTLPIVGYYPALIILTGVMAWVWVVVAWVGMKYFRHAKISGD